MVQDFKQLEAMIWDLDNTLYRFEQDFEQACHIAAAHTALKHGFCTDFKEALAMAEQSYLDYGHSYWVLVDKHGYDYKKLHFDYHGFTDEKLISKTMGLAEQLEKFALPHVILTHASRDWAGRVLKHLGLKDFFPDERIFAFEDFDFQKKSEARRGYEDAARVLGYGDEQSFAGKICNLSAFSAIDLFYLNERV